MRPTASRRFASLVLVLIGIAIAAPVAGQETSYTYTTGGRLAAVAHPSGATETFAWDAAGSLVHADLETGQLSLHVAVSPPGAGTVIGGGIACPGVCAAVFPSTTTINLTAAAASGWIFVGWGGLAAGTGGTTAVTVDRDGAVIAYFAADGGGTDADPVPDALEMGPDGDDPGYDGNFDGVPDYLQGQVVSRPDFDGDRYLTVVAPEGVTLTAVNPVANPSPGDTPGNSVFPMGFLELGFGGLTPGACFRADLYGPPDPALDEYWKYGPTPSDPSDHWWLFDRKDARGAVFHHEPDHTRIALYYCDGWEGDSDLLANGEVHDPGGPARRVEAEIVLRPWTIYAANNTSAQYWMFPKTPVGSSSEMEVHLVNIGLGAIDIGEDRFLGEPGYNDPTIELISDGCEWQTVPGGSSCVLVLRYTPAAGESFNHSSLNVLDGAWGHGNVIAAVHLGGSSLETAPPDPVDATFIVEGSGRITAAGGSVNCTSDCTSSLAASLFPLAVTATPDPGWAFTGFVWTWDAEYGGTQWVERAGADIRNPMTVTASSGFTICHRPALGSTVMITPPRLIAVFEELDQNVTLSVTRTGDGDGAVVASTVGLACGSACAVPVAIGTEVTLTAGPYAGSVFDGFAGAGCSGTEPCTVTVNGDTAVTAAFSLAGEPTARLEVVPVGSGSGTVASSPGGIACGADCSQDYALGTTVTLTATPDPGATFLGWSGDGVAGLAPVTVAMDRDRTVVALFGGTGGGPDTATITVVRTGSGAGTVSSVPDGIACGADCSQTWPIGTVVTLTADPASGSSFAGWSGLGCGGVGPCSFTVNEDAVYAAEFALDEPGTGRVTVELRGSGGGSVTSAPAGIACPGDCEHSFQIGTMLTLTAVAGGGSEWVGWSGAGCGSSPQCSLTVDGDHVVTAEFRTAIAIPTLGMFGIGLLIAALAAIGCAVLRRR